MGVSSSFSSSLMAVEQGRPLVTLSQKRNRLLREVRKVFQGCPALERQRLKPNVADSNPDR
jgi:hypothetical protein